MKRVPDDVVRCVPSETSCTCGSLGFSWHLSSRNTYMKPFIQDDRVVITLLVCFACVVGAIFSRTHGPWRRPERDGGGRCPLSGDLLVRRGGAGRGVVRFTERLNKNDQHSPRKSRNMTGGSWSRAWVFWVGGGIYFLDALFVSRPPPSMDGFCMEILSRNRKIRRQKISQCILSFQSLYK